VPCERLPAAVAVSEDVGETDAGYDLAGSIHQSGEPARKSRVPLNVRAHFREVVGPRLAMGDVLQHLAARMQRAIDIRIFEFVSHHAGNSISVLAAKSRSPVLFEFDERGLGLRPIFGAINSKRGERERRQNRKQGYDFHVQIVT